MHVKNDITGITDMGHPARPVEPALVSVRVKLTSSIRFQGSGAYAVYVDGRPIGSSPYGTVSAVVLPAGPHSVHVRKSPWVSDVVELDLVGGDQVDLVCELKPLISNKFFKLVETKFLLFAVPLALIAYLNPGFVRFIEENLKYEFVGVVFLFCFAIMASFPKLFSRKPGAMLSLVAEAIAPDDTTHIGETAWDVVRAELHQLVRAGAHPYLLLGRPDESGRTLDDRILDVTAANNPLPMPAMVVLAGIDTAGIIFATSAWLPRTPSVFFFVIAAANGLAIGFVLGLQILLVLWLRTWWRARRSALDRW